MQYLGLVTQKSTLNKVEVTQYYYNHAARNGDTVDTVEDYSLEYYSEHYKDPWATALKFYGSARNETGIKISFGDKSLHLDV